MLHVLHVGEIVTMRLTCYTPYMTWHPTCPKSVEAKWFGFVPKITSSGSGGEGREDGARSSRCRWQRRSKRGSELLSGPGVFAPPPALDWALHYTINDDTISFMAGHSWEGDRSQKNEMWADGQAQVVALGPFRSLAYLVVTSHMLKVEGQLAVRGQVNMSVRVMSTLRSREGRSEQGGVAVGLPGGMWPTGPLLHGDALLVAGLRRVVTPEINKPDG